MCRVGNLKDPVNQLLYKQGMEIAATSHVLYSQLHGRKCNHQHEHQPLEGDTYVKGNRVTRTSYSENYTRKFARMIAKIITKINVLKEHQEDVALVSRVKRPSGVEICRRAKRVKLQESQLIEPTELPAKRRRMHGKGLYDEYISGSLCDQIVHRVLQNQPHVGKREIEDPEILQSLQEVFPEKQVVKAIACRGTERTIPPPKNMTMGEAPYRRAMIIQRQTKKIMVENIWENWEELSYRQQWRRSHPSFLNITVFVFACNPSEISTDASPVIQTSATERELQSPVPDEPSAPVSTGHNAPAISAMHGQPERQTSGVSPTQQVPSQVHDMIEIDAQSSQHGEKFRNLSLEDRRMLIKLHKNLGHPAPSQLSQVLSRQGYAEALTQAVHDMRCSVCQMQQKPRLQRPAALKDELDFNDKVSMDGVKWTSKNGQEFHFYHFIDHGTNYHTAIAAPNKAAIQEKYISGWMNHFGTPNEILMDSAREFISENFTNFLEQMNVKCTVVPPGAHWQMGRIERHGGILQEMLSKIELEWDISDYLKFQQALAQCTAAKNSCSLRRGFSPEVLVFGKGLKVPGSITGDETLPGHCKALDENSHGIRFRELLSLREAARKAFHAADNDMALRRAILRRGRPHRGSYTPGEWVMVWRSQLNQSSWVGPAKVIQQDAQQVVFCDHHGSLIRAAPEHIRPVSAIEARLIPSSEHRDVNLENTPVPNSNSDINIPSTENTATRNNQPVNTQNQPQTDVPIEQIPETVEPRPESRASEQPDQEPEAIDQNKSQSSETDANRNNLPAAHEVAIPNDTDDELVCDALYSVDLEVSEDLLAPKQAWRLEFEINLSESWGTDPDTWPEPDEDMIYLATNSKKDRTEVKLSTLSPEELEEFEKAKSKEVQNWLHTGTVSRILRSQLSPEQIMRCRWIHVWKPIECPEEQKSDGGKTKKAKARLVVLGFTDPQLDTIPRDSPTLGRVSKMLLAQVIASNLWTLMSFDIRAAFLQGSTQDDRVIAIEPVVELRQAMKLKQNEVCRLVKSAYGLIDAPYLWFKELDGVLQKLGFRPAPFDPCCYVLHHPQSQQLSGVLGIHVDDGLCGGDSYFQSKIAELEQKFPFGSKKSQQFVFTGIEMKQLSDYSILMSQEKYVTKIEPIHIDPIRKAQLETPVTEQEKQQLRGLIGSLQYASVNTRPDLSSRLSSLQSEINKSTIATLIHANQVLHEAKRHKDTHLKIQPIEMNKVRFLAFSDASFASKKQPESHIYRYDHHDHSCRYRKEPCVHCESNFLGM